MSERRRKQFLPGGSEVLRAASFFFEQTIKDAPDEMLRDFIKTYQAGKEAGTISGGEEKLLEAYTAERERRVMAEFDRAKKEGRLN